MHPKQKWPNENFDLDTLNKLKYTTPFLVMDTKTITAKYAALQNGLPKARIHYAVKCNPDQKILATLKENGSYFEIASEVELERLIAIGVEPKDVIFSNPMKIASHISNTFKKGVKRFAFDSVNELKKLAENAPGCEVYLRVSVSNRGSIIPLDSKFGAHPNQAIDLLEMARDFGLTPIGFAFHVGSQAENIQSWDIAFEVVSGLYAKAKENGFHLKVLNIGGGYPVHYSVKVLSIEEITTHINNNLKKHHLDHLEIWSEPGRYLVGEAGVMVASVIGRASRGNHEWLYLDIGRFNGLAELFESEELRYPVISSKDGMKNTEHMKKEFTLTGPSCDSFDTIFHDVPVNAAVEEGDRLYFGTAGAYTTVYASEFNDFKIPDTVYLN